MSNLAECSSPVWSATLEAVSVEVRIQVGVSVRIEFVSIASAQLLDDFTEALSIESQIVIRSAFLSLFRDGNRQGEESPTRHDWTCESPTRAVEPFSAEDDLHMLVFPIMLPIAKSVARLLYC